MASPYRKNAVYGNLAYDLDALVRERQLEEAGKLPQKKQPAVQEQSRSVMGAWQLRVGEAWCCDV